MFYNTSFFPFAKKLESNWVTILDEFDKLDEGIIPYLERDLYEGNSEVFPFLFFGEQDETRCRLCPKTWDIIKDIPGIKTGAFSILRAGTEILPHTGFTSKVLRSHLGLIIPSDCAMIVGGERYSWREGECVIFDDTVEHSAYNRSNKDRAVLLIDVERPKKIPKKSSNSMDRDME